jgi:nitroreductase
MQIDEFLELLKKRRSIRRFKPDPVPDEYMDKILEAGRWAMSGANGQPWEFVVVKDLKTKNKIYDFFVENRSRLWNMEKTRLEELRHPSFAGVDITTRPPAFKDAPVLIVVCGDPRTFMATVIGAQYYDSDWSTFWMNLANACQNLQLGAAALGLASEWVSISNDWEGSLKNLLGIPEFFRVRMMVPVGYPAYKPATAYRRELKEIVHYERYDGSKFRSDDDILKFLLALRKRTRPSYPGGL